MDRTDLKPIIVMEQQQAYDAGAKGSSTGPDAAF
jgi:hypothetical protein